jgi:hypothetical protein
VRNSNKPLLTKLDEELNGILVDVKHRNPPVVARADVTVILTFPTDITTEHIVNKYEQATGEDINHRNSKAFTIRTIRMPYWC